METTNRTLIRRGARTVIGVVHLAPLPGAPGWAGDLAAVIHRARADLLALAAGGVDAAIIENYGDVPFRPGTVEPETVAAIARVLTELRPTVTIPLGVNVLRNDAAAALALAATCAGPDAFMRINVHTGAMVTDQGIIAGQADQTLRRRRELGATVAILADVQVKHATPLGNQTLEEAARDLVERGLADAVIVTGVGTGQPTALADLQRVRAALPATPLLVGSGATEATVGDLLTIADGVIVGTALKENGNVAAPVATDRVRAFVAAAQAVAAAANEQR